MGVISTKKSLVQLERLSTSSMCRRRLSVVMVRLKMAETLREACTFIEQVPVAPQATCCALTQLICPPAVCCMGRTSRVTAASDLHGFLI